jgi:hypothetical protein
MRHRNFMTFDTIACIILFSYDHIQIELILIRNLKNASRIDCFYESMLLILHLNNEKTSMKGRKRIHSTGKQNNIFTCIDVKAKNQEEES